MPATDPTPTAPVGLFTGHDAVGQVALPGSAAYDPAAQAYAIAGAGHNVWGEADGCHLAWRRLRGDFILSARVRFLGAGTDPHRKLGWMVRTGLAGDAAHASGVVHGDGLTALQFRPRAGAATGELRSPVVGADLIQLERAGRTFTLRVARFGEPLVATVLDDLDLGDEVLAGLFVCSHRAEVVEQAVFSQVRLIRPFAAGQVRYRDYLGSHLEVLDVHTGDRRVVLSSPEAIEAPNWTLDGRALIGNCRGRLLRIALADGAVDPIDSGFAVANNNDHVLSPDGRSIAISHHSAEDGGRSIIYVMPLAGGTPRRVTARGPSYLHGWSPDGRHLVYTGERDGAFDLYRIPVEGGEEVRLTSAPGLDDGSEYSPDGRTIWFNSNRSGAMRLWRMAADGSGQEPVTGPEGHDWFPHVSPDGRWVAFLTYGPEVAAGDHPYYQQVVLRLMPATGGVPRIIAYLYGGQGTMNVPSWSPDSRRIAFVSNSGPI